MDLDKILEKIYDFYPPDPALYKDGGFYKSIHGNKVHAAWESQDEVKSWLPFIDKLNQQTGLDLITIYRGTEFCFKAYGDFNKFSADKNIDTTIVVSVSTLVPFHCIYVTPVYIENPIRTFFDDKRNSIDFFEPCYSDECKQIGSYYKEKTEQKCVLLDEAREIIKNISDIVAQNFQTTILPLDLINKRIDKIAIDNSYVGDVNIYTAAFTPHII
jgi:hypothetical protein